jgi:hypothetical protein
MFFDVLDWSRFVAHDSNLMGQDDAFSAKSNYIKNRPKMLKTIHDCYEARYSLLLRCYDCLSPTNKFFQDKTGNQGTTYNLDYFRPLFNS